MERHENEEVNMVGDIRGKLIGYIFKIKERENGDGTMH